MSSELFSLNAFADTWMTGITLGLLVVFVVGWLVLSVRLTALWKIPGFVAKLIWVVGMFASVAVVFLLPLPHSLGHYQALYVTRAPEGDRLLVLMRNVVPHRTGSSSHYALVVTELEQAGRLAVVKLGADRGSGSRPSVLGSRLGSDAMGSIVWINSTDGVIAVDVRDGTVVGRESEATAKLGAYRSEGFDVQTGTLNVLLQDGRRMAVPIGEPPTTRDEALEHAEFACRTQTRRDAPHSDPDGNLLRARPVVRGGSPCNFAEHGAPPVRLVLHRSTAFDEGAWLLSAQNDDTTLWTHDLTERLGSGEMEVLWAESKSERVLRVLIGRKVTIYALELDLTTGYIERELALY